MSKKFCCVVMSLEKFYCICRKNSPKNICEWVKKFYYVVISLVKFYCECVKNLRKNICEWVKNFVVLWYRLKKFIVNAEKFCVKIFVSEWKILLYLILLKNFYCEYWRNLRKNICECVKKFIVPWCCLKNFIVSTEKFCVKIFVNA